MPLLRYFACVGCALLALLFAINWTLPPLSAEPERASADRLTIRIHSQHKWPSAVVFDTTLPTIVPPPAPVIAVAAGAAKASGVAEAPGIMEARGTAEASTARPVRDAFALAAETPAVKPPEAVKPAKPRAHRAKTARRPAQPLYQPFGFRNMWAAGW